MELNTALSAFAALSQDVRLEVLKRLVQAGPGGIGAGALAGSAGVAPPTMSFHLKALAGAGLVRSRKEGRRVLYAADYGGIRALVDFLLADCCQGDPRLCGPYIVKDCA
jgi:DNA-binding transcriptional ArsR family regulator